MDLTPIIIFAIVTWGVYRLFELYARRKERMTIIEKMEPENWGKGLNPDLDFFPKRQNRNMALTLGLLLIGIGLGMLVGYIVYLFSIEYILHLQSLTSDSYQIRLNEFKSIIIGSSTLLFGGAALLAAYLIERKKK